MHHYRFHSAHVRRRRLELWCDCAGRKIQHDLFVRGFLSVPLLDSSRHGRDGHRAVSLEHISAAMAMAVMGDSLARVASGAIAQTSSASSTEQMAFDRPEAWAIPRAATA